MTSAIGMPNSKSVVKALPSQMSVDASGNVGIGTTSPAYKLDVNGTANFTGDVSMNDVSMNGVLAVSNAITTDIGYPYYQSLGTEYIVNPPSTTSTIHGVNITGNEQANTRKLCIRRWPCKHMDR